MFKKAKRKIVVSILSILCAVLVITLGMVYLTSYLSATSQNYETLEKHSEMFSGEMDKGPKDDFQEKNENDKEPIKDDVRGRGRMERNLQIGTFYTVKFLESGETVVIENGADGIYSDEELISLAEKVKKKEKGRISELIYIVTENDGEILVSLMDNTVFNENFTRLFVFTLVFGVIAIIAITFISVHIANRIVSPMEETYKKQKQFTSDAGHELKTPIAAVAANTELLRREIGENKWLENVVYENERMSDLVGQLLFLSKAENSDVPKEIIDLSKLVAGEVLPLEALAFEKGKQIESDVGKDITVEGNTSQLRQLVSILLDNALSHGTGDTIGLSLHNEHHSAVIKVSNESEELSKEQITHLFDRFYRTDESRTDTGSHYGLGLSIAQAVTEAHGGKIHAEYKDGRVIFTVSLPKKRNDKQ